MDSETLNLEIDYLGSSGIILSTEQKSLLEISLALLRNNEKLDHLQFWGKIRGMYGDYYISKSFDGNYLGSKRFYYSKDCLNWGLLNPPTEALKNLSENFDGLFTGDPSHVFETKIIMKDRDNESKLVTIKEEDRLACVLHFIERDVLIAPRKALIKVSGKVIKNKSFNGLLSNESNYLYNYLHIRECHNKQNLVGRKDFDAAIDFMDTIEGDTPKRCWSLQIERGGKIVILKSLLWIGYVFYHVIGTHQFGSLYFGVGQKNIDLPFML